MTNHEHHPSPANTGHCHHGADGHAHAAHDHAGRNHAGHGHSHANDAELAQMLDLDAHILGSYLEEITAWAAELAVPMPAAIIDVGAGSGVGSIVLARRFPTAHVTALDMSAQMIATTLEAATANGLDGRITGIQTNLNEGWPASASGDLMWASSSLHELADPEQTMADMFAHLSPGGLLMVVEMDSLPSFLPASAREGENSDSGLESRLHAALSSNGWNQYPEWTAGLERAGFVVERRHFPTMGSTTGSTTQELAALYGRIFLSKIRGALADSASAADLAALEVLLGDSSGSLERRGDLVVRGHRTAWAAHKPVS